MPRKSALGADELALHFTYRDGEGVLSERTVSRWRKDSQYFTGYCQDAHDMRTFRRDRVVKWLNGSDALLNATPIHHAEGRTRTAGPQWRGPPSNLSPHFEGAKLCLTGFEKEQRDQLTDYARGCGFIVAASVTNDLDFLLIGARAGPAKLAKARAQRVTIMDVKAFRDLTQHGVMPEPPGS